VNKISKNNAYGKNYSNYLTNRGQLRIVLREKIFLNSIVKKAIGKSIDFGCGRGGLLKLLPKGSLGLEVNQEIVKYLKKNKFNAKYYSVNDDKYLFQDIPVGVYKTFIMNHVLEHIPYPKDNLKKIIESCHRLGIERIMIIVPCIKGFKSDTTHIKFINKNFFYKNRLIKLFNFEIKKMYYYPFNLKFIGDFFKYNELRIIYDKIKK